MGQPHKTFNAYEDLLNHMSTQAPNADILPNITAELGNECHTVWINGHIMWHAWKQDPDRQSPWVLDQELTEEALVWIREQLCLVLGRIADPTLYQEMPAGTVERDENVLFELYDVELESIQINNPRDVDLVIQWKIQNARAEVARLAGLRVHHIVNCLGGAQERGWQARVASALGVSEATISGLLASERERQNRRRNAAHHP